MRRPYCTLNRRRFGLRMIARLLALSSSCVFPAWLHASLPQAYDGPFSLMMMSAVATVTSWLRKLTDTSICAQFPASERKEGKLNSPISCFVQRLELF